MELYIYIYMSYGRFKCMSAGSLLLDLLWLESETYLVLLRATLLSCDKNGLLI